MVNTTYCDVCNHEYKCYKNTLKPTNTHSIFSDKYLHLTKKQNIVIDVIMIFLIFFNFYNKHLQSRKHKNNEEREAKFSIENTDGAFKGHIKIRLFRFQDPGPSSIMEAVDVVKCGIETIIKNTLSEIKTFKFCMGVKLNMVRQGDETTPYSIPIIRLNTISQVCITHK